MTDDKALRQKLEVSDWSHLTPEKAAQALLDDVNISKEEIAYLMAVVPRFIDLARLGVTALQTVAETMGASQVESLKNLGKAIDAYREIAKSMTTDEARMAIADRIREATKDSKKQNKENNRSFADFSKLMMAGLALFAIILSRGRSGGGSA